MNLNFDTICKRLQGVMIVKITNVLVSGWLKHPISMAPIDRHSLQKLLFTIPVGYDFMDDINYTSPLNPALQKQVFIYKHCLVFI